MLVPTKPIKSTMLKGISNCVIAIRKDSRYGKVMFAYAGDIKYPCSLSSACINFGERRGGMRKHILYKDVYRFRKKWRQSIYGQNL